MRKKAIVFGVVWTIGFASWQMHQNQEQWFSLPYNPNDDLATQVLEVSNIKSSFGNVFVEAEVKSRNQDGFRYLAEPVQFDEEICQRVFWGKPSDPQLTNEPGYCCGENGEELWISEGDLLFYRNERAKEICDMLELAAQWEAGDASHKESEILALLSEKSREMAFALGVPIPCDVASVKVISSASLNKIAQDLQFDVVNLTRTNSNYYQIDLLPHLEGIPILSPYAFYPESYVVEEPAEMVLLRFVYEQNELIACRMIGCTQPTMLENQTYDFAAESSTKPLQAYFSEIIFDGELFIHTIYPAYCLTKDYTSDRFLFEPVWCYEGEVLYPHERRDSIHVFLSAERKATRNDSHTTL